VIGEDNETKAFLAKASNEVFIEVVLEVVEFDRIVRRVSVGELEGRNVGFGTITKEHAVFERVKKGGRFFWVEKWSIREDTAWQGRILVLGGRNTASWVFI
jgi:hypothetical protein